MTPIFKKLKAEIFANDLNQKDLAELLDCSTTYISNRMLAKHPWTLDDVYKLCEALEIAPEQIHEYFPRGGVKNGS